METATITAYPMKGVPRRYLALDIQAGNYKGIPLQLLGILYSTSRCSIFHPFGVGKSVNAQSYNTFIPSGLWKHKLCLAENPTPKG
jgi:hypothetical protein